MRSNSSNFKLRHEGARSKRVTKRWVDSRRMAPESFDNWRSCCLATVKRARKLAKLITLKGGRNLALVIPFLYA